MTALLSFRDPRRLWLMLQIDAPLVMLPATLRLTKKKLTG